LRVFIYNLDFLPSLCFFPKIYALWILGFVFPSVSFAVETDQFTVPAHPLIDISEEITNIVRNELQKIVEKLNLQKKEPIELRKKIPGRLSGILGHGIEQSAVEIKIKNMTFEDDDKDIFHNRGYLSTIYFMGPTVHPLGYLVFGPTINFNQIYLGTDKFGHFFQHGFWYYSEYLRKKKRGLNEDECIASAVATGKFKEAGLWGIGLTGVYSNADLTANLAGLLFYKNLTEEITLGGQQLSPIIEIKGEELRINPDREEFLLTDFITDHFDESLNPSKYDFIMRLSVRNAILKRCRKWKIFYNGIGFDNATLGDMNQYFGIPYGHSGNTTLVNCF